MRKMFFINFFMALFIIVALSLNANADLPIAAAVSDSYFISAEGSDSNPGTEEKPWKTIQRAAEAAAPGSTVYIKAGIYYERIDIKVSGKSADEPTIFRNYKSDQVIIDGSQSSASVQEDLIHVSNQSFVQLIGLELVNNINEEDDFFVTGIGVWGKGEGIEIRNCKIHQIRYTGDSADSGAQAIAVYGRDGTDSITGLVIDGNEIWDIMCGSREAIAISGNVDGFQFTNNYIHDNNNTGLALMGDKKLGKEPVCPIEEDNRARNGFVGYNKIERNSRGANPSNQTDFGAAGICADGAKDITIAYNTCAENDVGIVVGNETRNKVSSGILVRDNLIFRNNAGGLQVGGTDVNRGWAVDCSFLNNTLYSNATKNKERGEINIAKSHNLEFNSNIIYTGAQNLVVATENFGAEHVYYISFDNNLYYGPGGSRGLRFKGIDTGLTGLNMWKNKTKQDSSSRIADPRFVDAANGDFRLLQGSPAIDFGNPNHILGEGETDFSGEKRINGKAIDCGAYEY